MQLRRSEELAGREGRGSYADRGARGALMHDYDVENQFELGDLAEDSDSDDAQAAKRTSFDEEQRLNGRLSGTGRGRVQKEHIQPKRNSSLR